MELTILSCHYDPLYTIFLSTIEATCLLVRQGVSPHTTNQQNIHTDIPGLQTGEYTAVKARTEMNAK